MAAHLARAGVLIQLGRGGDAGRTLDDIEALSPEHAQLHYLRGVLALRADDRAMAERHLSAAVEADPAHVDARFTLGNLLRGQDRCAEALALYDEAAAAGPLRPALTPAYAICLADRDRLADARSVLEVAHDAAPEDPTVTEALARVLASGPDEARAEAARAVSLMERLVDEQAEVPGVSIFTEEALAMAVAAAGDGPRAVALQRGVVERAEREGVAEALLAHMRANLARYEVGQLAERPWAPPAAYSD